MFSPPRGLAGTVDGLRFWRPFNVACEFARLREHSGRLAVWSTLKPNFRSWAFYAVWEDEAAADRFLETSPVGRGWAEQCSEAWHLWLRPLWVRGPWEGMQLLRGSEAGGRAAGPMVCLTRLDLTLRGTLTMWGSSAPHITHHLPAGDEMLASLAMVDRPYVQPMSFSVWPSADAAMDFAHRRGDHTEAVARIQKRQPDAVERFSSGRFRPYRVEGTLNGRNPLAAMADVA